MPPTIPRARERMIASVASSMNLSGALASQQQSDISDSDGQVALRTGVLGRFPTSGDTWTSGWGLEVLSDGVGSAPVLRAGIINYSDGSSSGTVIGLILCKADGSFQTLWDGADAGFLQLLSAQALALDFGTATLTWSGSTSASTAVSHGLGRPPQVALALLNGAPARLITLGTDTLTDTHFTLHGLAGAAFTGSATYFWVAIG